MSVCGYVQVRAEARGVRVPGAGVTGGCEPSDLGAGTKLEFSASAVSALDC